MRDTIMRGVIAGAVATPVQAGLNWAWFFIGLADSTLTQLFARALLIIPPGRAVTLGENIVGLVGHFIIGLLFAVIISYIIRYSGWDYYLIKGVGTGMLIWAIHLGLLPYLAQMPMARPVPVAMLHLLDHGIWGLLTVYMLRVFSRERIISDK